MNTQHSMGKIEWLMLLSLSFLWGFSFINIKNSLIEIPPFSLVFIRLCIAALFLFIWCKVRNKGFQISSREHLILLGGGLISCAIPFSFFTWGQQYVSTSIGAVFNGCVPFFTAFLAHFLLGGSERMTLRKGIGLAIGLTGIITIMGVNNLAHLDITNIGQLLIICACFFYGSSGIYFQKFVPAHLDKTVVATCTLTWAALATGIVSVSFEGLPSLNYSVKVWGSVTVLAVFSTAVAYIILFKLLKRAGPTNTSLNTFIIPVVGIFLGISLMGESLKDNEILGILFIFIGVGVIQNFPMLVKKLISAKQPPA